MIKLLIVDDSALMRRLLGNLFKAQEDFEVAFARDGLEALKQLEISQPDVITLDVQMPNMDGLKCLNRIMLERPCPVVMVSSLTETGADATLEAMRLGAVDFIPKPSGAVSLSMDDLAPLLVEKVRAASKARLSRTLRLTERVRLRTNGVVQTEMPRRILASNPVAHRLTMPTFSKSSACAVLVGSSTGGPPALETLLTALPADFPWPLVIAQHMPGSFTGPLARRLDKLCALTIMEVTQPTPLVPGHAYIGKGDADVILGTRPSGTVVMAAPSSPEHRWHPSVDRLVMTAIQILGAKSLIGVLMTGMGNDGAASMTRLRAEGGRTIAEAEETAIVWGMPGELVKTGGAEVVAPLDTIAEELMEFLR